MHFLLKEDARMNGTNNSLTPWVMEKFITASAQPAAKALEALATHEAILLLKPLKAEHIIACINFMDPTKASAILRRLPSRQAAYVLARLDMLQAAKIYAAFSIPQREKIKTLLDDSFVQAMQQSAGGPAQSAGALMSRDFISFRTETKIAEIVEKLKNIPRKKLPLACVIVNKEGVLKGLIPTAELAFFPAASMAGSVMSEAQFIQAAKSADLIQETFEKGQILVPVVDENNIVLGVLTSSNLPQAFKRKKRFSWF